MSNSSIESGTLEKTKLKIPSMWTVVLHNDDYTPMDFVIVVLTEVFHLDNESAYEVMMTVHNLGSCPVGKFTREIAITKAATVCRLAEQMQHPLQATAEEM